MSKSEKNSVCVILCQSQNKCKVYMPIQTVSLDSVFLEIFLRIEECNKELYEKSIEALNIIKRLDLQIQNVFNEESTQYFYEMNSELCGFNVESSYEYFTKKKVANIRVDIRKSQWVQWSDAERCELLFKADLLFKRLLILIIDEDGFDKFSMFSFFHDCFSSLAVYIKNEVSESIKNKVDETCNRIIFHHHNFYRNLHTLSEQIDISVVLPVYNSENYILDSVWSVLKQSFENFELIIIHEFDSNDSSLRLLEMFEDDRIKIIKNREKLSLAESLNVGIRAARGKYIARMDSDDICIPDRFQIQWKFMEENKQIGLIGGWQRVFDGIDTYILKTPVSHDDICAQLVFDNPIGHSTVFFRKELFEKNNLWYRKSMYAEDRELWIRAGEVIQLRNLPQILVEYRLHNDNITKHKLQTLAEEASVITCDLIKNLWDIEIPHNHRKYMNCWINYYNGETEEKLKKDLKQEKKILDLIIESNKSRNVFSQNSLLKALSLRFAWARGSNDTE